MGKKKILTEDLFNTNGNATVSVEILNETKETENVEETKEEIKEEKETPKVVKSIFKNIEKKIGFNDESYYYNDLK